LVVNKSNQFQGDVVRSTIKPFSGVTPYVRWGNWAIVSLVLGCIAVLYMIQMIGRGRIES